MSPKSRGLHSTLHATQLMDEQAMKETRVRQRCLTLFVTRLASFPETTGLAQGSCNPSRKSCSYWRCRNSFSSHRFPQHRARATGISRNACHPMQAQHIDCNKSSASRSHRTSHDSGTGTWRPFLLRLPNAYRRKRHKHHSRSQWLPTGPPTVGARPDLLPLRAERSRKNRRHPAHHQSDSSREGKRTGHTRAAASERKARKQLAGSTACLRA